MAEEQTEGSLLFRAIKFSRDNKCFFLMIRTVFYSAFFRAGIFLFKPKRLKKHWGIEKEESAQVEPEDEIEYVCKISRLVLCVCNNTKWESKCLVRALTARKLLCKKKLHSTMYMGVKQDTDGKMLAHAWLRWGKYIVTGILPDLKEYAVVTTFKN